MSLRVVVIEGDPDPWFRKAAGHLFGMLRDDLTVRLQDGAVVGRAVRQGSPLDRSLVEFPPETTAFITPDVLSLALGAVLILDPDRWHPWPFG